MKIVIFHSYVSLPEGNDWLMGFSMHPFSQSPLPLSPGPFQGRGRNLSRRAGPLPAGWKTLEVWERLGAMAMDFDRCLVGVDEVQFDCIFVDFCGFEEILVDLTMQWCFNHLKWDVYTTWP